MEKMNIQERQAFRFVIEGLVLIGFPDNIEMHSYVGDGDKPCYYATYEKEEDGKVQQHIKPLTVKDVVSLMKFAMELNGFDVSWIDIRAREDRLCYSVGVNIVSYGSGAKKSKRRR